MLERVQRKGNPFTLLVGMQTSTATMENNVEIPKKTGNRTAILSELNWVKFLSHVWLFATPWTSLPGSSIHGIFQARILEWVAISFSRGSSRTRDQTQVSRIAGRHFKTLSHQGSPANCHMTQHSHCWAYTLKKTKLKETHVHQYSLKHCLQ